MGRARAARRRIVPQWLEAAEIRPRPRFGRNVPQARARLTAPLRPPERPDRRREDRFRGLWTAQTCGCPLLRWRL